METRGVWACSVLVLAVSACSAHPPPSAQPVTVVSAPAQTAVAVIGDSFSSGSDNDVVWPEVLADRYGWDLENASQSGAGYVAGDGILGTFADQVDAVVDHPVDVVLVVGSENDVDADPKDVGVAAADLYRRLELEAPSARIVVIGPIWSVGDPPPELTAVGDAVQAAAAGAQLSYVDPLPLGWLADPALIQEDGDHPTDVGQAELADDISDALGGVDQDLLG
ncbi:SGNH/GDSL hydrolase family protein [Actinomycetes bacterium M1A6_2h]